VAEQIRTGRPLAVQDRAGSTVDELQFPGARVLVVDDSEVNREVAAEALARLGAEVDLAEDGGQAVERLRAQVYDLVLMDGSMPVLDGFEATVQIRREEEADGRKRATILALTAHVVGSAADAWRTAGMDGVIHKPFTMADLAAALNTHCGALARQIRREEAVQPDDQTTSDPSLFDAAVRAELDTMAKNGRPDFVAKVEGLYAANAPLRLADLRAALGAGDGESAARAAHALKSMSLSLGAAAVARAASAAENAARSGHLEAIDLEPISALLDRTLAAASQPPVPASAPAATIADEFAAAVDQGHVTLVYQPMVDRNGLFAGEAEALVRWNCPKRGTRSPDEFVPALEAVGAITQLTDFALRRAFQEGIGRPDVRLSVNASAAEFQSEDFADRVARAATETGFPLDRLEIEVTETAILDIERARPTVDRLADMGVGIALDDFGSGYTSLHALRRLRFSTLKIDRSFVSLCCDDTASAAIIHAVIGVGRAIGMKIVCEGVETAEQARFLRTAGVHYLQGYFYHRP